VTVTGEAPLTATGALDLRATGGLDLAMTDPLLTPAGRRARGRVSLDAGITGTLAGPRVTGGVQLANGSFRDFRAGDRRFGHQRQSGGRWRHGTRDAVRREGPGRGRSMPAAAWT